MNNITNISEVHDEPNILTITSPGTHLLETHTLTEIPHTIIFDSSSEGMITEIVMSYSFDGTNFSKWFIYDPIDLDSFNKNIRDDFIKGYEIKLQFKIICTIDDSGTFDNTKQQNPYYYTIHDININNLPIKLLHKGLVNQYDISYSEPVGLWNPYDGMKGGLDLYTSISNSMNNVLGHWVYYFKTDPDIDSKNIHLRTFELYQVVGMKKIKVLVPNNTFPSAMNIYHEFGIQFPDEFNIHILNNVFEQAFGTGAFPKTKDYLYFPINNIMYEVNAFYKPRTFMEKSIYSELILNKYENDSGIEKNEFESDVFDYVELFDDGTISEPGFKEAQEADPNYLNVDLLEAFRLQLHKNLEIVENPLYIGQLQIFRNQYLFSNITNNEMSLSFNALDTLLSNVTFSGWYMFEKLVPTRLLTKFKDSNNQTLFELSIKQGKLHAELFDKINNISHILESNVLEKDIQYGIGISISNTFSELQLNVIHIINNNEIIFDIEQLTTDITPIANSISLIELYGGPHLITNIRLDDIKVNSDKFINHMTSVLPDSKTNILFDKAHLPISDEKFTI